MGSFVASWGDGGWMFERWHCAPGPPLVLPVHEHDCYQLSLTLDLPAEHRYRGELHQSSPGATSVVHPGEPHETRQPVQAHGVHRYLVAYVPVTAVEAVAAEIAGRPVREPFFEATVVGDSAVRAALRFLVARTGPPSATADLPSATSDRPSTGADLPSASGHPPLAHDLPLAHDHRRLVTLTRALLVGAGLTPARRPPPVDAGRAALAVGYLREHYARPVGVAEIVRISGLSERQLYRSFTALTGVPPHRYQLNLRIEHAKRLLAAGSTVTAAAAATGFADQSHLTRHFKRQLGLPPGRYGARWREGVAGTFKP